MVAEEDVQAAEGLISFIEQCPSMFHTAATISARLEAQGFVRLLEGDAWRGRLEPGGRYYAERNGSARPPLPTPTASTFSSPLPTAIPRHSR